MRRSEFIRLSSLSALGLTFLGAGCQPATPAPATPGNTAGSGGAPAAGPAPTSKPASQVGSGAAGASVGKVVVGMTVDANSLDFMKMNTTNPEFSIASHLFDALVSRDADLKIQPALAESWKTVDEKTWEFKLRQGVKFHDGEPFNAAAVKYTFDRAADPATKSFDQTLKFIYFDRVEVVDDYTVRIFTKSPAPSLLVRLTYFYILPPKYYTENGLEAVALKPVGTGAFKFVEWTKNDHLTLEANSDYFGGAPAIKTIVFRPIPETGTRLAELKSGGIDIALSIPPDQAKSAESDTTRLEAIDGGRRILVGFHVTKDSPVADKRVRQAINYAVDVDAITKSLFGRGARAFNLVTPNGISPNIKPWPYDPAKAKALLAEAGYPNGFAVTLDSPSGRYLMDKEVSQAVADYLTRIGIQTTVKTFDWSTYTQQMLVPRKTDALFFLGFSSNFDPAIDVNTLDVETASNPTEWKNDEYQALLKQIGTTMDEKERLALVYKAQELAYDEAPWLWMYFQPDLYGVSKRLDWKPRVDEYVLLHKAKLAK